MKTGSNPAAQPAARFTSPNNGVVPPRRSGCTCGAGDIDAEGAQADGPCVCE